MALLFAFVALLLAAAYVTARSEFSRTALLLILLFPLMVRYPILLMSALCLEEVSGLLKSGLLALGSSSTTVLLIGAMVFNTARLVWQPGSGVYRKLLLVSAAFMLLILIGETVRLSSWPHGTYQLRIYAIGLLCLFQLQSRREQVAGLWILTAASVFMSVSGLAHATALQATSGIDAVGRDSLTDVDPNYMSVYIGCGLIWLVSVALVGWREYNRVIRLAAIVAGLPCMAALLRLASRGVMSALLITVSLIIWNAATSMRQRFFGLAVLVILSLTVYLSPLGVPLQQRLTSDNLATASERVPLVLASINYLTSAPIEDLLVGGGIGWNFQVLGRAFGVTEFNTHNAFLHVAIDQGLVGLLLFLSVIYCVYQTLRVGSGTVQSNAMYGLVFLLICSLSLSPISKPFCWIAFSMYVCKRAIPKRSLG